MWKVRYLKDGELVEAHFSGSLLDLVQSFAAMDVRVIQFAGPASSPPTDAAEGSSSVSVKKS